MHRLALSPRRPVEARTLGVNAGVTLVELVVVVALTGIIALLVGSLLGSIWSAQSSTVTQAQAATELTTASSALDRALRTAVAVEALDSGSAIRVRTTLAGEQRCQGFALTGGNLVVVQAASGLPHPSAGGVLVAGVTAAGTTPFATAGDRVRYDLIITSAGGGLPLAGTIASRAHAGAAAPCW